MKQTPLHDSHVAAGARMAPFAGWDMPIHFGSQVKEHHAVRADSGKFDVSHMTIVDFGSDAMPLLQRLITNDAADTWFNGYHPEVATTVWVGFPDHQALGANEYGSNRRGMHDSQDAQEGHVVTRRHPSQRRRPGAQAGVRHSVQAGGQMGKFR